MNFKNVSDLFLIRTMMTTKDRNVLLFVRKQSKFFEHKSEKFLKEKLFHLFPRKCGFMYYFGFVLIGIIYMCFYKTIISKFNMLFFLILISGSCLIWDNLMSGDFVKFIKNVFVKMNYRIVVQRNLFSKLGSSSKYELIYIGVITDKSYKKFSKKLYRISSFPRSKSLMRKKPMLCIVSATDSLPIEISNVKQYLMTKQTLGVIILDYYLSKSVSYDFRDLCCEFYQKVYSDYLNYSVGLSVLKKYV